MRRSWACPPRDQKNSNFVGKELLKRSKAQIHVLWEKTMDLKIQTFQYFKK